jgi:hypothetical protein
MARLTPKIRALLENFNHLPQRVKIALSTNIGKGWDSFAANLKGVLQIEEKHHSYFRGAAVHYGGIRR